MGCFSACVELNFHGFFFRAGCPTHEQRKNLAPSKFTNRMVHIDQRCIKFDSASSLENTVCVDSYAYMYVHVGLVNLKVRLRMA